MTDQKEKAGADMTDQREKVEKLQKLVGQAVRLEGSSYNKVRHTYHSVRSMIADYKQISRMGVQDIYKDRALNHLLDNMIDVLENPTKTDRTFNNIEDLGAISNFANRLMSELGVKSGDDGGNNEHSELSTSIREKKNLILSAINEAIKFEVENYGNVHVNHKPAAEMITDYRLLCSLNCEVDLRLKLLDKMIEKLTNPEKRGTFYNNLGVLANITDFVRRIDDSGKYREEAIQR